VENMLYMSSTSASDGSYNSPSPRHRHEPRHAQVPFQNARHRAGAAPAGGAAPGLTTRASTAVVLFVVLTRLTVATTVCI